jgi:hypothetical protein
MVILFLPYRLFAFVLCPNVPSLTQSFCALVVEKVKDSSQSAENRANNSPQRVEGRRAAGLPVLPVLPKQSQVSLQINAHYYYYHYYWVFSFLYSLIGTMRQHALRNIVDTQIEY